MTTENKLTESEIHELALVYAREKLVYCLNNGTIHAEGMQEQTEEELKFLAKTYKNASFSLQNIGKYNI